MADGGRDSGGRSQLLEGLSIYFLAIHVYKDLNAYYLFVSTWHALKPRGSKRKRQKT